MAATEMLLRDGRTGRAAYEEQEGYAAWGVAASSPETVLELLLATSLTGLGGAHFPFATKVQLCMVGPGPRVVVCNAAEDEPGSRKDRALLETNPHVVVEGALIAAAAVEATDVYFYVSEVLTEAIESLTQALDDIGGSIAPSVTTHIFPAPPQYVAGEATAAVRAINGGEAKPLEQPPYPTERGVGDRPTLVANCETLANLPRIVRVGVRTGEPGGAITRLATVTGDVARPGVYEIDVQTTTVADLIELAGGMVGSEVLKAFQPGGPSSAFLPAEDAAALLSNDAIRAAGSQPGCLAVRVLSKARCIVEVVEEIDDFFRREQCGQCPACRMKTQTYHRTVLQIQSGHGSWDMFDKLSAVDEFASDLPRRCSLINMPTAPTISARRLFPDDFASHIERQTCPADQSISLQSS